MKIKEKTGDDRLKNFIRDNNKEAYEILRNVMKKTGGEVNNAITAILALTGKFNEEEITKFGEAIENFTSSDIGVIAKKENAVPYYFDVVSGGGLFDTIKKKNRISLCSWNTIDIKDKKARTFSFRDTYLYRAMVNCSLNFPYNDCDWVLDREFLTNNSYGRGYSMGMDNALVNSLVAFYRVPKGLREKISEDENLSGLWLRRAHIQKEVPHYRRSHYKISGDISITDEEWRKFQTENIIREFDWLVNSDNEVAKLKSRIEKNNRTENGYWIGRGFNDVVLFHNAIRNGIKDAYMDKNIVVIEDFYRAMEYLGIGIISNVTRMNKTSCGYKSSAIAKKISNSVRRFIADVKKGYEPEDVRELLVEDLNKWITEQARGLWRVFVRTDAPKEYNDIPVKGTRKSKQTSSYLPLGFEQAMEKFNNKDNND